MPIKVSITKEIGKLGRFLTMEDKLSPSINVMTIK